MSFVLGTNVRASKRCGGEIAGSQNRLVRIRNVEYVDAALLRGCQQPLLPSHAAKAQTASEAQQHLNWTSCLQRLDQTGQAPLLVLDACVLMFKTGADLLGNPHANSQMAPATGPLQMLHY